MRFYAWLFSIFSLARFADASSAFFLDTPHSVTDFFNNGGKVNLLVFYGRKKYIRIMYPQLLAARRGPHNSQQAIISQIFIAPLTTNKEDLEYLEQIVDGEYIVKADIERARKSPSGFCGVLKKYIPEKNTQLIKIDHDIIYIPDGAFYSLLKYKLANPHLFAVSANVINHSLLAYVHAMTGVFLPERKYDPKNDSLSDFYFDYLVAPPNKQLACGQSAVVQHQILINNLNAGTALEKYNTFRVWDFNGHGFEQTWSVNCFIYDPRDIVYNEKDCLERGDEYYLSLFWPKKLSKHSVALGSALVAHFAFHQQLHDTALHDADILSQYEKYVFGKWNHTENYNKSVDFSKYKHVDK